MKTKLFYFTLLLLTGFISLAQVNNLSEQNRILLEQLQQDENARIERVNNYLNNHPNYKLLTSNNPNTDLAIYDIFDGKPVYKSTDNLSAARATKTDRLQVGGSLNLNLDGTGMTVGVWDGGPIQLSHTEFQDVSGGTSRAQNIDGSTTDGDVGVSNHGTHVSGTIAARGVDPEAKGMATNISLKTYNWNNDTAEMLVAANDPVQAIVLSNHSYGIPINQGNGNQLDPWRMGAYTSDAAAIDNVTKNNPFYLPVMSAGNSGNVSYPNGLFDGFDKLTGDKNSKNALIIANANPTVTETPIFSGNFELTGLAINSSSSEGPTDDLRIKPDIAADGTGLKSPVPGDGYATFSGTSMAAPNTTGTLALLQQYYNQLHGQYMLSSTLRGLVCHTAVDDFATPGPDPIFGWGFLDAQKAIETIQDDNSGIALVEEINLVNGATYSMTFSAQSGDKLEATICWTDLAGSSVTNGDLNNQTPRLVNDLDLRISKDGVDYLPWRLDYDPSTGFSNSKNDNTRDNIEKVEIEAPSSGVYTLTVSHKGVLQGNVGGPFDPQTQDFSIILTGKNVALNNPDSTFESSLKVFPNPNNGSFNVQFMNQNNDKTNIRVYDIQGREVFQKNYRNPSLIFNEEITLSNPVSGVYFVNITQNGDSTTKKLIVE